jgi:hypothetical protein
MKRFDARGGDLVANTGQVEPRPSSHDEPKEAAKNSYTGS